MSKKAKKVKVPVSTRALVQRINRKLKQDGEKLHASRPLSDGRGGVLFDSNLGRFYIVDERLNTMVAAHVDPEALGRELSVLKAWETLVED